MKKLPLGIEDFKALKESCYYVDKTYFALFICKMPETSVCLFTRPRRFGKSLALSMLEYFFSNKMESSNLFSDTKISKFEEINEYINKINVIHLDLKNIDSSSFESFIYTFNILISKVYASFFEKNIDVFGEWEKKYINKIINVEASETDLKLSLDNAIQYIYKLTGGKTLVLIDEYDAPLNKAYSNGFYQKANDFMRMLLSGGLKGNKYLWKGVLTGVTQIAHSSALSDLNNLRVYNVFHKLNEEYFGFNQEEVDQLLEYYSFNGDAERVKQYYGGYTFSSQNVYNPWSILSFINNGFIYDNYWSNTGSYDLLKQAINQIGDVEWNTLGDLLYGNGRIIALQKTILLDKNDVISQTYSLLVFTGYLTSELVLEPDNYYVRIPNEEIKNVFKTEILKNYTNSNTLTQLVNLKKSLLNGDVNKIKEYFTNYLLNCFSYYDLNTEKTYQIIVTTLLAILFSDAVVKSEVNEGLGRCDILVRFKDKYSIIFEIKKLKGRRSEKELNASSIKAVSQIKNKKYYEEALKEHSNKIMLCGISFCEKNIATTVEEVMM